MSDEGARLAWVDWLKVLGVLAVSAGHVAVIFDPWHEWHVSHPVRLPAAGAVTMFLAPWLMPLFMLLAGFAAHGSLARRGARAVVVERLRRIGVPMVLGVLLLVPPQVWAERVLRGEFTGSLLQFYPRFFDGWYPRGNFSWHHLWFLGHLLVYSIVALPLFRYWGTPRGRVQLAWLTRVVGGPFGLFLLALPLVIERALVWLLFERHGLHDPDWTSQSLLFGAYVWGFALAATPALLAGVDRSWPANAMLGSAVLALLASVGAGALGPAPLPPAGAVPAVLFWGGYAVGAWAAVLAVVGAARRWLTHRPRWLSGVGRASLWFYLVNQPVIVLVASRVVARGDGPWTALGTILASSLAISLALTLVLSLAVARRAAPAPA